MGHYISLLPALLAPVSGKTIREEEGEGLRGKMTKQSHTSLFITTNKVSVTKSLHTCVALGSTDIERPQGYGTVKKIARLCMFDV